MGATTLAKFRSRLEQNLGDRGLAPGQLDDWINDGYFDLSGSFDFVELRAVATDTLVDGADKLALPSDLAWVRSVFNVTDEKGLVKMASENFHQINDTDEGEPTYWTRDGQTLWFSPISDKDRVIKLLYNTFPVKLDDPSDVTVLPPTWDRAVLDFAQYHAYADLGERGAAVDQFNKAMRYVRSRLLSQEFENSGSHMGVRLVRSREELQRVVDQRGVPGS